jgi:hypothetical protein
VNSKRRDVIPLLSRSTVYRVLIGLVAGIVVPQAETFRLHAQGTLGANAALAFDIMAGPSSPTAPRSKS